MPEFCSSNCHATTALQYMMTPSPRRPCDSRTANARRAATILDIGLKIKMKVDKTKEDKEGQSLVPLATEQQ